MKKRLDQTIHVALYAIAIGLIAGFSMGAMYDMYGSKKATQRSIQTYQCKVFMATLAGFLLGASLLNRAEQQVSEKSKKEKALAIAALKAGDIHRWNCWRATELDVELPQIDLSGCNLAEVNLSYVQLHRANLSRANLRDANLQGADLRDADLSYVDLSLADLAFANLSRANLSHSNLENANLDDSNFSFANLQYCNLRFASAMTTNFAECVFSGANINDCNFLWAELDTAIDVPPIDIPVVREKDKNKSLIKVPIGI